MSPPAGHAGAGGWLGSALRRRAYRPPSARPTVDASGLALRARPGLRMAEGVNLLG